MAEGIFTSKIQALGLTSKVSADSAGTSNYHIGEQPDTRTLTTLAQHDIPFNHAARQISHNDGDDFDYILAMDQSNFDNIRSIVNTDNVYLMRDFDDQGKGLDVPDPYYGGTDGFERVYQMLDRSMENFIQKLKSEQSL